MKKALVLFAAICTLASCSFVNDLSKHCTVYKTDANVKTGSFDVCAKCDSLADVVKKKAAEIKVKQAAKQ